MLLRKQLKENTVDYLEQLPPITEDEEEEELSPRVIEKLEGYSKVVIDGEQIILFVKEETSTFTIYRVTPKLLLMENSKVVIDGEQIILFVKEETSTFTIYSQFFL